MQACLRIDSYHYVFDVQRQMRKRSFRMLFCKYLAQND